MNRTRPLVAALWVTLIPTLTAAQTNTEPSRPAQKQPAKTGAQGGRTPGDLAASAAAPTASSASAARAEKKPAKAGAQSGPAPGTAASRP